MLSFVCNDGPVQYVSRQQQNNKLIRFFFVRRTFTFNAHVEIVSIEFDSSCCEFKMNKYRLDRYEYINVCMQWPHWKAWKCSVCERMKARSINFRDRALLCLYICLWMRERQANERSLAKRNFAVVVVVVLQFSGSKRMKTKFNGCRGVYYSYLSCVIFMKSKQCSLVRLPKSKTVALSHICMHVQIEKNLIRARPKNVYTSSSPSSLSYKMYLLYKNHLQ